MSVCVGDREREKDTEREMPVFNNLLKVDEACTVSSINKQLGN